MRLHPAATACVLVPCGGELESPPPLKVEIGHAYLIDDGTFVTGAITATVTASAGARQTNMWAGAMLAERDTRCAAATGGRRWCDTQIQGWLLDLPDGGDHVALEPGETREVRLIVKSGNRPATNPGVNLAKCGELVTVVLVPELDGAQGGAFDTRFRCAISALTRR